MECSGCFFLGTGNANIYFQDEAKSAGCTREIYPDAELIVPTFNCELRVHKPPLHYYFMTAGYGLFGKSAFVARSFSSIIGCLVVLLVLRTTAGEHGESNGMLAGRSLLGMFHYICQVKQAVPGPFLIGFILAAIVLIYLGPKQRRR